MKTHFLDRFFVPKAVACAGSIKPGKIGYEIIKSMKEGGYQGNIYPVNPGGGKVFGLHVFTSVLDIPEDTEIVLLTPSH